MEKIKTYGSLILTLMCVFLIGTYSTFELYNIKDIESYRWFMTSFVGLGFLVNFISRLKNE